MIEKLRLNQFCSCCTVRTGSLVIGVFGWMLSLLNAIALSTPVETTTIAMIETDDAAAILEQDESGVNTPAILTSIFMFCISVSLLIGVYKDNRQLILPWLVIKSLECVAVTIATVVFFFLVFVACNPGILFLVFLFLGGLSALLWYCWLCVWSFYMDLGEVIIGPVGNTHSMIEPMQMQIDQYPPPYPTQETTITKPLSSQQKMV